MSRQTINLCDDDWHFGQVPCCPFTAKNVDDFSAVTEWLPAMVPGNVRTDLLALGRIPDPFFGEQYKESLWVEAVDWWYRRELQIEPLQPDQRAFLIFEGIDYLSAIFVNGREMARHEGMFSRQVVEVTKALQAGTAEIAVRLWGSTALPKRRLNWRQRLWQLIATPLYGSWVGIYPDRSATLKCQMSFGWDFAPPIRTMGIWDEVSLVITGPVFITEASAIGRPVLADPQERITHAPAKIRIDLTLEADRSRRVETVVEVSPANFEGRRYGPFHFPLELPAERSHHRFDIDLPEAALWQPWDRGQPHLYEIELSLIEPDGARLDQTTIRTGIRSIDRQGWHFSLNGQRGFMRGLNWVPADSFPGRLRRADYHRLLTMAREGGANLLRVWGGGLREKRAFYELCDELGLLVWQEFPFACMFLGTYPRDAAFLSKIETECSAIVRQLGHHPSLILWCGGNEFSPRRNRPLVETLASLVRQHDGTRPFIPVSPSRDHGGDAHNWHVWHGEAPFHAYQAETARFLSEFGLQALPDPDTLKAMLPDPTTGWPTHHADLTKLKRYTACFQTPAPPPPCPPTPPPPSQSPISSLQSLISASQRAQATALQIAIEHMRRRKGEAGGVCLWQFNEPWPAISWAIVDYFGRPKLAYERLKEWYNPVLISLKFSVGHRWQAGEWFMAEIWAINDTLQQYGSCELQIKLDEVVAHLQTVTLPPDSVQRAGVLAYQPIAPPEQITLTLCCRTEILAQNRYDLTWSDQARGPLSRRLRRWVADFVLR